MLKEENAIEVYLKGRVRQQEREREIDFLSVGLCLDDHKAGSWPKPVA